MCGSVAASRDADHFLFFLYEEDKAIFWHCVEKSGENCDPGSGADLDLIFESRF